MPPQSSSTSSSEAEAAETVDAPARTARPAWRSLARTAAWCAVVLVLFEVLTAVLFTRTRLANGSLRKFLWYGVSYEQKVRELVHTPNLPPRSILHAGWIDPAAYRNQPSEPELTIYGMSFSNNTGEALKELRPDMSVRMIGGPGAPLSHAYGAYLVDRPLRRTRFAMVGVTSGAVQEVLLMNRGSLFADAPFPYFFPRFELVDGKIVKVADSLINTSDELRAAIDDPVLWGKQLDVLAAHDDGYRRFYFASDWLDYSLLGRLVRRGLSKHHAQAYTTRILGPNGFRRDHQAVQLFRALLRQMVSDLRTENVQPIVFLYALQGQSNHLFDLVNDILRDDKIPYVNSFDLCRPDNLANYVPDMHFIPECDTAFAKRVLALMNEPERRP